MLLKLMIYLLKNETLVKRKYLDQAFKVLPFRINFVYIIDV